MHHVNFKYQLNFALNQKFQIFQIFTYKNQTDQVFHCEVLEYFVGFHIPNVLII
jgi:hypothetical protein